MTDTCLITGVAGFIGSHLAERLLHEGHHVVGIDCFTDYYERAVKEKNIAVLRRHPKFSLLEDDLCSMDLRAVIGAVDCVFHLAAQAGVRGSWGASFDIYTRNNIQATQRLLEATRDSRVRKFIYSSSSSVYGNTTTLPVSEDAPLRPYSPYGVTKLAAEHLCHLYHDNFAVPTVALRYFTVYGPRQRPDMAFHRFIRAIAEARALPLYGDGQQTRDFTYVSDVVEANLLALRSPAVGRSFNIGGGARVTVNQMISVLEEIIGQPARIERQNKQHGDAGHTWADTSAARQELGFQPRVALREGLAAEVNWLLNREHV